MSRSRSALLIEQHVYSLPPISNFSTILIISLLLLLTVTSGIAQKKPKPKFGRAVEEEIRMQRYEKDTTAHAVVLYDRGYLSSTRFTFTRHVKIKVFSNAGTSFANFTVNTPAKSDIHGYTYNIENGVVKQTKLEKSSIYREEIVDGFEVYKIFFPEVKPGSVIELSYSHTGIPGEWRFQNRIPVIYSELVLETITGVNYKKTQYGFEPITAVGSNSWIAEDMPGLELEPYMGDYSNYLTSFQFEVSEVSIPQIGYYRQYSTSWEKISEQLLKYEYFGVY